MGKKKGGKALAAVDPEVVEDDDPEEVEEAAVDEDEPAAVVRKAGEETTLEELLERHKREMKEMKNECQRLKKQVTQGDKKKKKDIQTEIEKLEEATTQRHQRELAEFNEKHNAEAPLEAQAENLTLEDDGEEANEDTAVAPEKRVSKAQKKKAKKEEKQNELRRQAEEEAAKAPNLKQIEEEQINRACSQLGLLVKQIVPDGHCLYNAVADQLRVKKSIMDVDYKSLRSQVAAYLRSHPDDYLPFITDDNGDMIDDEGFKAYCNKLENTAEWGGQLEIRVISQIFQCPVFVLQAGKPLTIGEEFSEDPLQLSYHRHAYGLGEHYNSLVSQE